MDMIRQGTDLTASEALREPKISTCIARDEVGDVVRDAAEKEGRVFAIMLGSTVPCPIYRLLTVASGMISLV